MEKFVKEIIEKNNKIEKSFYNDLGISKVIFEGYLRDNLIKSENKEDFYKGFGKDLQDRFPNGAWRTINGAKVFIEGDGKVVAGLKNFNDHIDKFFDGKKEKTLQEKEQDLLDSQEAKDYTLKIPYKFTKLRKRAKSLGAKWNSVAKVWEIKAKKIQLEWEELDRCIIGEDDSVDKKKEKDDTFGTGAVTTRGKARKYGYDSIER